ncbi:hypothetical protein [Cellulomonas denverensis]|uniref:hypothetical protein n=1 Tax=Cellulomonas denverensis TaxID=264297 RepID=UPI0035EC32BF
MARDPWLLEQVQGPDPAVVLAEPVEELRAANDITFLVVMSPEGTRYTHPDPEQIGGQFQGTIDGARAGRTTVEDYTGTLGPSVRVVTPITNAAGGRGRPGVRRGAAGGDRRPGARGGGPARPTGPRRAGPRLGDRLADRPARPPADLRARPPRAGPAAELPRRPAALGAGRPGAGVPGRHRGAVQRRGPAAARPARGPARRPGR